MLKNLKQNIVILITLIIIPLFITCSDTSFDEDRYVIINVNYSGGSGAVDSAHPLWAVIFLAPNWTNEFLRFSSATTQIMVPIFKSLNLNEFLGYVAVVYDSTGTGNLQNQLCIGYQNSQFVDFLTANLDAVAFLEIKTLSISVNLDAGAANFPTP
jgi:hypothetical protein